MHHILLKVSVLFLQKTLTSYGIPGIYSVKKRVNEFYRILKKFNSVANGMGIKGNGQKYP